jgi:hypothetical protein
MLGLLDKASNAASSAKEKAALTLATNKPSVQAENDKASEAESDQHRSGMRDRFKKFGEWVGKHASDTVSHMSAVYEQVAKMMLPCTHLFLRMRALVNVFDTYK